MKKSVSEAIQNASSKHGVPLEYMTTMAAIESSFNPDAKNKSGACGLYQLLPGTARELGLADKECFDPSKSADAAARYTNKNLQSLRQYSVEVDLNINPEYGYLAHQQGAKGIAEIIKAAKEGKEVSAARRRNMDANGGLGKTPAEFLDFWKKKYKRLSGIKSVIGDFIVTSRNFA